MVYIYIFEIVLMRFDPTIMYVTNKALHIIMSP